MTKGSQDHTLKSRNPSFREKEVDLERELSSVLFFVSITLVLSDFLQVNKLLSLFYLGDIDQ